MNTALADKRTLITANEWFGGGHRIPYDPDLLAALIYERAQA